MSLIAINICMLIFSCVMFFALVKGKSKLFVVSIVLVIIGFMVLGVEYPEELKRITKSIGGPISF